MWPSLHLPATDVVISTYQLLHVAGWFAFLLAGLWLTRHWPERRRHWWWLVVGVAVCDTLGSHSLARLVRGGAGGGFWGGPLLIALWGGGYLALRRIPAYPMLDAFAVAFRVSQAFAKLACLAAGCCFGRRTASALGVPVPAARGDPTRFHPLPLFEMSLHVLTALVLGELDARGILKGRLVLVLGIIHGAWRAMIEPLRGSPDPAVMNGPLTATQLASIFAVVFGATYRMLDTTDLRRLTRHQGGQA